MKKILITGANSYIGTSFENYMKQWESDYQIDTIDMIDGTWKDVDFSPYETVFHVAGIAHQKETTKNKELYYKVNRDLAVEVALKSKNEGIRQFIFLSSMSVYGMDTGIITKETVPKPKNNYGRSKLQAEELVNNFASDTFNVVIVRPPMVYGKDCKGNFQTVKKLVCKFSFFPKVNNQRSMIYIGNLCRFVKFTIEHQLSGVYFPQNKEFVNTSIMAKWIAETNAKSVYLSRFMGLLVNILGLLLSVCRKAFGTLIYKNTEDFNYEYCEYDNESSVKRSV